jgi:hypothetical protein
MTNSSLGVVIVGRYKAKFFYHGQHHLLSWAIKMSMHRPIPVQPFWEILEHYYLEILKKTRHKIFCDQKQYRHSLRTEGDSQKEHNTHTPLISLICSYRLIFLYYKCLYTYYPSCSLSDLRLYDTGENFIEVVKLVFNPIVYIWQ